MATNQTIEKTIIKKTPGVCGGQACVGNRRIPVWHLVECQRLGMTDECILDDFDPPLTSADLEAAREYYSQNQEEIDAAIRENDNVMHEEAE